MFTRDELIRFRKQIIRLLLKPHMINRFSSSFTFYREIKRNSEVFLAGEINRTYNER